MFVTLGSISLYGENGFISLMNGGQSLAKGYNHNDASLIQLLIKFFENFAIITSFLGVALALFSFNRDLYSINSESLIKRLIVLLITLLPPLFFAMFFVNSFISALGYASIFVSLLLIIQPVMMAWSLRNTRKQNTFSSKVYLSIIFTSGILIVILQLLASIGKLAHI